MKLFASLVLIASTAFSQTFNFETKQSGDFQTSDTYKLPATVQVEIGHINVVNDEIAEVNVKFNGINKRVVMKIVEGGFLYLGDQNVYKGIIETQNISDDICGEYESVEFEATITEEGEYDHYSFVTDMTLKAVKEYTYDSCHSEVQSTEYNYNKIQ